MSAYLIISSFLNFLAAWLLGFAVLVRGRHDRLNYLFGLFAFSIGGWSAGYLFWQTSETATRALLFSRLLMAFASFVPVTFFHFIAVLCGARRRWWVRISYVCSVAFMVLNFTPLMITHVGEVRGFRYWPMAGPWYWLYLVFFAVQFTHACWLLWANLRASRGSRAIQLRNILIAALVGFGGGATNFPLWYGVPLPPYGNLLIFLYLVIIAHAVSQYQLPLISYDFVHAAVYIMFSMTMAVCYLLVLTFAAPLLGLTLTTGIVFTHFLLCMVVALFFFGAVPRLNRVADLIMAQTLLRRRNTRQLLLKELGTRIASLGTEREVYENCVTAIAKAFELEVAAVYARTEFDRSFQLGAARGPVTPPPTLPFDSVLVRVCQVRGAPMLLDGSERVLEASLVSELEAMRAQLPLEAIFPIASDDFLTGVLVLGARKGGERYSESELALLESLCVQIAVTLRARQLERRSSQTEKLISLGTLAAGLAHELRNPLTSIQTFTALLHESHPDPEALKEFSAIVQRDVSRIAGIVENVSAFAESNKVEMTSVQLAEVLRTVEGIMAAEFKRAGVEFRVADMPLPAVRGNPTQLLQVFVNLVQNSIEAMEGRNGAAITVDFDSHTVNQAHPLVVVAVADNGPGIDPAVLPHIFEPFITTKATGARRGKHGMGLGLAIVKRIIQHHHGEIHVASEPGKGTVFRVYLPLQPVA